MTFSGGSCPVPPTCSTYPKASLSLRETRSNTYSNTLLYAHKARELRDRMMYDFFYRIKDAKKKKLLRIKMELEALEKVNQDTSNKEKRLRRLQVV